ncbi:MAG: hypothetical protein HZB23_15990 [Deltaproteobacteria bacterium]|nr:hypothetical protein [Deltaproteobacteria bacterium]
MREVLLAILLIGATGIYNFDDALLDSAPNRQGAEAIHDLLSFFNGPDIVMDQPTGAFFDYVADSLENFSFPRFYANKFMRALPGGFRGVAIQGARGTAGYNWRLSMADIECMEPNGLGNFIAELGLKKTAGPTYLGRIRAKIGTGMLSHENTVAFTTGLLKVTAPENVFAMQSLKGRDTRMIPEEALQVIAEFYKAFPRFAVVFKKYIYIYHSLLRRDRLGGTEFTRSTVRAFFRMEEISKDFPALYQFVKDIKGFFRIRVTLKNRQGNILSEMLVDAKEDFFSLKSLTRDGKIIPFDAKGNPVFSEAVLLTALTDYSFDVFIDNHVDVYGLKFDTPRIRFSCRYQNTPKAGSLDIRLAESPKTRVTGKLGDVVPAWLVNMAIPSDMAGQVNSAADVFFRANNGQGTNLRLSFDTTYQDDVVLRVNGGTEFLDNFFTGFTLSTLSHRLQIKEGVRKEAMKFFRQAVAGLLADVDTYRKRTGPRPPKK